LREPVDAFFEAVMINAEDASVRANRYAIAGAPARPVRQYR
jgi:glycyl-tRNA synthetase beta chain